MALTLTLVLMAAGCAKISSAADPAYPATVPEARLFATKVIEGRLIYAGWIVNGAWHEQESDKVPDGLEPADMTPGRPFEFQISTNRLPTRVDVFVYIGKLDAQGLPAGDPELLSCHPGPVKMPCTFKASGEGPVQVTARPSSAGRLVVVNAGWDITPAGDAAGHDLPTEVSASWIFAV